MKIAVPTLNGKICMHFGHCEIFTIIDVENKKVMSISEEVPPPHEPGVLPKWLAEKNVNLIIAGGMGMKAQQLFASNNIEVLFGVQAGTPKEVVEAYLENSLETGANVCDH